MTPQQLAKHLERAGVGRKEFCDRLGVTEASFSFWIKQGWLTYERQCHVENELAKMGDAGLIGEKLRGGVRASWDDVPDDKRPQAAAA